MFRSEPAVLLGDLVRETRTYEERSVEKAYARLGIASLPWR
jgi:hypothetical protein